MMSYYLIALKQHVSRKLEQIGSIWRAGRGVMSLSFFHNTTAGEAFTREACMIEAIGGCGPPLPPSHPTPLTRRA